MKKEVIKINKITAEEGHVFASLDKSQVFSNEMYLGKEDSPDNYIEITIEEAEAIQSQQEKQ